MKIEDLVPGKTYFESGKGKEIFKLYFVGTESNGDAVFEDLLSGQLLHWTPVDVFLLEEYKEPVEHTVYLNIFRNPETNAIVYSVTNDKRVGSTHAKLLHSIPVTWTEDVN